MDDDDDEWFSSSIQGAWQEEGKKTKAKNDGRVGGALGRVDPVKQSEEFRANEDAMEIWREAGARGGAVKRTALQRETSRNTWQSGQMDGVKQEFHDNALNDLTEKRLVDKGDHVEFVRLVAMLLRSQLGGSRTLSKQLLVGKKSPSDEGASDESDEKEQESPSGSASSGPTSEESPSSSSGPISEETGRAIQLVQDRLGEFIPKTAHPQHSGYVYLIDEMPHNLCKARLARGLQCSLAGCAVAKAGRSIHLEDDLCEECGDRVSPRLRAYEKESRGLGGEIGSLAADRASVQFAKKAKVWNGLFLASYERLILQRIFRNFEREANHLEYVSLPGDGAEKDAKKKKLREIFDSCVKELDGVVETIDNMKEPIDEVQLREDCTAFCDKHRNLLARGGPLFPAAQGNDLFFQGGFVAGGAASSSSSDKINLFTGAGPSSSGAISSSAADDPFFAKTCTWNTYRSKLQSESLLPHQVQAVDAGSDDSAPSRQLFHISCAGGKSLIEFTQIVTAGRGICVLATSTLGLVSQLFKKHVLHAEKFGQTYGGLATKMRVFGFCRGKEQWFQREFSELLGPGEKPNLTFSTDPNQLLDSLLDYLGSLACPTTKVPIAATTAASSSSSSTSSDKNTKNPAPPSTPFLILTTYNSITSVYRTLFEHSLSVRLLQLDEAHHMAAEFLSQVLQSANIRALTYKLQAYTGTPVASDWYDMSKELEETFCWLYDEGVRSGMCRPIDFMIRECDTKGDQEEIWQPGSFADVFEHLAYGILAKTDQGGWYDFVTGLLYVQGAYSKRKEDEDADNRYPPFQIVENYDDKLKMFSETFHRILREHYPNHRLKNKFSPDKIHLVAVTGSTRDFLKIVDDFNTEKSHWSEMESGHIFILVLCRVGEEGVDFYRANWVCDLTSGQSVKCQFQKYLRVVRNEDRKDGQTLSKTPRPVVYKPYAISRSLRDVDLADRDRSLRKVLGNYRAQSITMVLLQYLMDCGLGESPRKPDRELVVKFFKNAAKRGESMVPTDGNSSEDGGVPKDVDVVDEMNGLFDGIIDDNDSDDWMGNSDDWMGNSDGGDGQQFSEDGMSSDDGPAGGAGQKAAFRRAYRSRGKGHELFLELFRGTELIPFFGIGTQGENASGVKTKFLNFASLYAKATTSRPAVSSDGGAAASSSSPNQLPPPPQPDPVVDAEMEVWKEQNALQYFDLDPKKRAELDMIPGFRNLVDANNSGGNKRRAANVAMEEEEEAEGGAGKPKRLDRRGWTEHCEQLEQEPHHLFAVKNGQNQREGRQPVLGEDGYDECQGKSWNDRLGNWVVQQRYKKSQLGAGELAKLNELGFIWLHDRKTTMQEVGRRKRREQIGPRLDSLESGMVESSTAGNDRRALERDLEDGLMTNSQQERFENLPKKRRWQKKGDAVPPFDDISDDV